MTTININSISEDSVGKLTSTKTSVSVSENEVEPFGEISGQFNKNSGEFSITIPHLGTLEISGLPSLSTIGQGPDGDKGISGVAGESGTIRENAAKGLQGDRGPVGEVGLNGYLGDRGEVGNQGPAGEQGNKGPAGQDGHIPYYIQEDEPESAVAGTIWVKRVADIVSEDVDISAPQLILADVTMYKDESRIVKGSVSNNLDVLTRFEITPEDDTYLDIEYPVVLREGEEDLEINELTFRVSIIYPEIEEDPLIEDFKNYSTTVNVFIENASGSDSQDFTLTILPELRN